MKLLQVYNDYRSFGGEAGVVQMIAELVERSGGSAQLWTRSSKEIDRSLVGKVRAFASGIYNFSAARQFRRMLSADRPDLVHVHNLYPLFSPSVLVAARRMGLPVVMTSHNYLLTCPIVNHLHQGRVCEKCFGGREYHCVRQNCRDNRLESLAYALRSFTARKFNLFRDYITIHIVLSEFARQRLIRSGFDARRIVVLPNMVKLGPEPDNRVPGAYVAFSGRMMPEKGVDVLLAAAARLPDVPFRLAGDGPILNELKAAAPPNVHFVGRLAGPEMPAFYRGARLLAIPSKWFEGCPLVVSEAMSHALPIVASRIGGLPEFVDEGGTGRLFEPGDDAELAEHIRALWNSPELCAAMGRAGREKAEREYSRQVYFDRLMAIYEQAIDMNAEDVGSRMDPAERPAHRREASARLPAGV